MAEIIQIRLLKTRSIERHINKFLAEATKARDLFDTAPEFATDRMMEIQTELSQIVTAMQEIVLHEM